MGVDLTIVLDGLQNAFSLQNLLWLIVGVVLGLLAGTLPGFTGGSMMAVVLPLLIGLPIDTMLIVLAAIYAANVYADSTAGILYNIPGGASGIPTTIEGYKMNQKGRMVEAFAAQVSGSFFGAMLGFLVLILLVPTFMYFVRFFGAGERALLAIWALVFIASGVITREDPLRAYLSVGVGLALALIGQQPNIGTFRFTLGLSGLWDGLKVVVLVLALFALPQLLRMIELRQDLASTRSRVQPVGFAVLYRRMAQLLVEGRKVALKSSLIGVFIGIIPGIGTTTASWAGYSVAQRNTNQPEKFGEGNRDGILGAESASNSCEVGTIVPLLALGIPGSAAAAIMLAALTMTGINPGPSMYINYGTQVWTIMFGIGLSGLAFTILAYPFIVGAQHLSKLSVPLLVGAIGALCVMGAYLQQHNFFGPYAFVILGAATVFGVMAGLKPAAILIGFVLGPAIEPELIRGYQIGGFSRFLQPASLTILVIIAATIVIAILRNRKDSKDKSLLEQAEADHEPDNTEIIESNPRPYLIEKLLSVLALGFAAFLLISSFQYPLFASLWIYFVSIVFIIIPGGMMLMRGASLMPTAIRVWQGMPSMHVDWRMVGDKTLVVAGFIAFIAAIPFLGFLIAASVFVFALVIYFDRNVFRALLSAVVVGGLLWAVVAGFGINMPQGILANFY